MAARPLAHLRLRAPSYLTPRGVGLPSALWRACAWLSRQWSAREPDEQGDSGAGTGLRRGNGAGAVSSLHSFNLFNFRQGLSRRASSEEGGRTRAGAYDLAKAAGGQSQPGEASGECLPRHANGERERQNVGPAQSPSSLSGPRRRRARDSETRRMAVEARAADGEKEVSRRRLVE